MPNRNENVITTPENEVSPERLEYLARAWGEPMQGDIVLEDMPPMGLQEVFDNLDAKAEEITKKDSAKPLDTKDMDEVAERNLSEYKNLNPAGRAIMKRGILKKLKDEQITSSQLMKNLQENPGAALTLTNNFYMVFNPELIEKGIEKQPINPIKVNYLALPYYLNERYDNVWSCMCEDLTKEVITVMEFAQKSGAERSVEDKESTDAALTNIATYLHDKAGISLYLLRP